MDEPTSAENPELPKAKRKPAKKVRKKDRRDKRREKKDRKKKGKDRFSGDEAEGFDDFRLGSESKDVDHETDVAWSPSIPPPEEPEKEPGFEVFYEMLVSELGRLREKVGHHERQLVDTAGPLIGRLPRPQQPYITGTCCCTKCCGRCCDRHELVTQDAGTEVDEEALEAEEAARRRRKQQLPVEPDMDTTTSSFLSDKPQRGPGKGGTKISRKKTEVKRTPAQTHIGPSLEEDAPSAEILRRGSREEMSRKLLVTKSPKSTSLSSSTLPSAKETPVRPLQDEWDELALLEVIDSSRPIPDLERLLLLDDADDRGLPSGRGLRDDPLGAPYNRWRSPASNDAAFAWPPQKYGENWSTGQIVYYTEPAASPMGEGLLRTVQSLPTTLYSARVPPEVITPYAIRQQYDDWPPCTPERPPPYQERHLSPLTAAALELSDRAEGVDRQAWGTLEAARVLKKASDDALQVAIESQYKNSRIYGRPPLGYPGRESQESLRSATRGVNPPFRMEVPQQPQLAPPVKPAASQQQTSQEGCSPGRSILKSQLQPTKPLYFKDATSERSSDILSSEENRSIMRQPLSLGAAQKPTIKPTEAESVGDACKPDGRPRARFAYGQGETTQKRPGFRRRGTMFVHGGDDEEMSSFEDEAPTSTKMTVALNDGDEPKQATVGAVKRAKYSPTDKEQDTIVSRKQEGAPYFEAISAGTLHERLITAGTRRKHETNQGKGKLEGFIVTDTWRKRDLVTVCDKSTWISVDQSTATPRVWTMPHKYCPPSLPCGVSKCLSPLSFLSPCSTCGKGESPESDTYLTPRSAQSMTSASQTSRPSAIESRKLSNADSSNKKAIHKKPTEKRKRKLSLAERRRSSLADSTGALRNIDDLQKGNNVIATTKLSDALLNIDPPDSKSEGVGGSSKRRGSRKDSEEHSKWSPALESKSVAPVLATVDANRRRSSGSERAAPTKGRRSSVTAEEKHQMDQEPRRVFDNLLRKGSAQPDEESVMLPVKAQPTSRQASLQTHDNLDVPLRTGNIMQKESNEVPIVVAVLLDDAEDDDTALHMDNVGSDRVRKRSLVKAPQKRASYGEISVIEARRSDLSSHGAGGVALTSAGQRLVSEDTGADGSLAYEKAEMEPFVFPQSEVSHLVLPSHEPEAQLTAVVTVPYAQDAKLWFYKDSTLSLFPESKIGVTTAFVCAGWIILLIFLSEFHHNWFYIHTTSSVSPTYWPTGATGRPPITDGPEIFTFADIFPPGTSVSQDTHQPMDIYFCATEHCEKEARYLSSSFSGNPCENFYENVCASLRSIWAPRYPGAAVSTTSLLAAQIQALTEEYIANDDNEDVKIARTLFSACVDWDEHRDKSVAAAVRMINEILGISWPVSRGGSSFLPDPWHVAGKLARTLNLEPLATLSVDVHPEKRRELILGLDEPNVLRRRLNEGQQLSNLVATSVEEATRRIDAREIADVILETMFAISDLTALPSARALGPENYRVTPLGEMGPRVKSMLSSALHGYNIFEDSTDILVKSPSFFAKLRASTTLTSGGLLNYLGYRVLLHLAAFVSEPSLEKVHALLTHGYVHTTEITRRGLCSWEVSHVLPAMYTRAFFRRIQNTSFVAVARAWSSQVEQKFQTGLTRLSWFREGYGTADPADLQLANHKLSTSRIQHFYPSWIMNDAMYRKYEARLRARLDRVPTSAFAYLQALHEARFAEKVAPLVGNAADLAFSANIFDASPRYDVQKNSLFVPASMMNISVPTNGSLFAFHIARFGVRTMRALVPALYNDFVFSGRRSDDAPLLFTEGYDLRLRSTTRCLVDAYRRAPDRLKSSFMRGLSDLSTAGLPLLEQTVALMQAFWAFQEMLTVKRVWRSDFRFSLLPHLSSDQLFFVYYALDNCEASDDRYRARAFEARFQLPPEERVNFPLLHVDAFRRAFGCPASSPMATASRCIVAS